MPTIGPTERQIPSRARSTGSCVIAVAREPNGNIGQGVEEAKQGVGDVGVDVLSGRTVEIGDAEQRDTGEQERQRCEEQVRPKLAPAGPREVDQTPGRKVGEGVPLGRRGTSSRSARIEPDDIRVVDEQEQRLQREGQVVGKVTRRVTEIAAQGQLLHRISLARE